MRIVRTSMQFSRSPRSYWHQTICLKCASLRLSDRFPRECESCGAMSIWLVAPPDSRDRLQRMVQRIRRQRRITEAQSQPQSDRGIGARGPSSGALSLSRVALVSQEPRAPMPPEAI